MYRCLDCGGKLRTKCWHGRSNYLNKGRYWYERKRNVDSRSACNGYYHSDTCLRCLVSEMREYRIIPDVELTNGNGHCNNPSCPKPTIYWNDAVRNKETGKKIPLSEPFTGEKPPVIHSCMRTYKPSKYINKTNDAFLEQISYSKELYNYFKQIHWTYQKLT